MNNHGCNLYALKKRSSKQQYKQGAVGTCRGNKEATKTALARLEQMSCSNAWYSSKSALCCLHLDGKDIVREVEDGIVLR